MAGTRKQQQAEQPEQSEQTPAFQYGQQDDQSQKSEQKGEQKLLTLKEWNEQEQADADKRRKAREAGDEPPKPTGDGEITYVDMGEYTLEVDRRGQMEAKRHLPKSQYNVAVTQEEADEIRARAEADPNIPDEDVDVLVPPVKKDDES